MTVDYRMVIRVFCITLWQSLSITNIYAQVPECPTQSLTPNAQAIQRYGDIPVSLYTGTPNISIPIDTLQSGKLELPIGLSYHSGGVKAEEHPGWVGLGWNLSFGGAITREMRDLPDELKDGMTPERGYMYCHSFLDEEEAWTDGSQAELDMYDRLINNPLSNWDTEPDKFNFNFDGYSGYFIMDSKGKWQVCCDRPLQIKSFTLKDPPKPGNAELKVSRKVIGTFTLVDEDGCEYTFGGDAMDMSIPFLEQSTRIWEASAWHLTSILHPNGDRISFEYERGSYILNLSYAETLISYNTNIGYSDIQLPKYQGQLLSPVYLKTVKGNNFEIEFVTSQSNELSYSAEDFTKATRQLYERNNSNPPYYLIDDKNFTIEEQMDQCKWVKLDTIRIKDEDGGVLKSICFHYDESPTSRLFLNEIDVTTCLDIAAERYQFAYHNPHGMPKYLSAQTDHWGFYNDRDVNDGDYSLSKNANPSTLMFGSLYQIEYPAGGKTIFEFEPHTYRRELNSYGCGAPSLTKQHTAGGIRIRRITDIPNDGTSPIVKEYRYTENYATSPNDTLSSGILEGCAKYEHIVDGISKFSYAEGSSESLVPTANTMGLHVGYHEVTEIFPDGSYAVNHFTSLLDQEYQNECHASAVSIKPSIPISSKARYRGKLYGREEYDSSGKKTMEIEISYEPLNRLATFVGAAHASSTMMSTNTATPTIIAEFVLYKNFTYSLVERMRRVKTFEHPTNIPLVTETWYRYNSIGQILSDSTVYREKGYPVSDVTSYRYAWEDNSAIKNNGIMSLVADIQYYHKNQLVNHITNSYGLVGKVPYVTIVTQAKRNGVEPQKLYQCLYADKKGNPLYVILENRMPVVYLWGHDYVHPVAEIKNATIGEVAYAMNLSPEDAPMHRYDIQDKISLLRQRLIRATITSYTFDTNLGITSITGNSGNATYYEYDDFGRLSRIYNTHKEIVTSFNYHIANVDNDITNYNQMLSNYLERNVDIVGPNILPPDSTYRYWAPSGYKRYRYQWSLEGDTAAVHMTWQGDNIVLHNRSLSALPSNVRLILTVYNDSNEYVWRKVKNITLRPSYHTMEIKRQSISGDTVFVCVTIRKVDASNVYTMYLYANGEFIRIIDRNSDMMFSAAPGGVRAWTIPIRRDDRRGFCQFTSSNGGDEVTIEINNDVLFAPILDNNQ